MVDAREDREVMALAQAAAGAPEPGPGEVVPASEYVRLARAFLAVVRSEPGQVSADGREVNDAVRQAQMALDELTGILALPREVGANVRWPHNGVVWSRVGDDDWRSADFPNRPYRAKHVAMLPWEPVTGTTDGGA